MDYTLALVFSLLQVLSAGTAAPVEVVKMKSKVKGLAEQLVVRLNKDIQVAPSFTLSPPTDVLDGSSSVVRVLEGYNSLISDGFNDVSQVKFDISSLTGYLVHWRQVHCTEQRPKPLVSGRLQELQSQKQFIHTVSMEALMRVKLFLNLLLKNLDHLEIC
ncbi:Leptin Precursor [Channa argus]|uniref:Leptin n=1 Tax=Channa argus TaxID=215402 RepID=A0A286ME91_CHAAH|nr:leptin [Channa argus]KAF3688900.1 Leptin Precursor [Channa argus]KAK2917924.1 hypothetical protein Q8A73_004670 [Channa argus]